MKFSKIVLRSLLIMALAITLSATSLESEEPNMLRGASRFVTQKYQRGVPLTCDQYPKICNVKGSAGPDCCKNKCVNLSTDEYNCGRCGKKCGFSKMCCQGKCVNPRTNEKHCGRCGNKCDNRGSCVYGMCSYA